MKGNNIVDGTGARSSIRTLVGLFATLGLLAAFAMPTLGATVMPTPIHDGNPTCGDFNAAWTQLKVEPPGNGQFTDGTLTVTITNFANSNSGTPGSFDWSSNIGVDAVFVKAGNDRHHLYAYNPESTGDTALGPQAGQGTGISHSRSATTLAGRPRPRRRPGRRSRRVVVSPVVIRRRRLPAPCRTRRQARGPQLPPWC